MRRKLNGMTILVLAAILFVGCSVMGGGQTNPILSKLVPGTLSDYGPTLAGNCTESCNVQACREYNINQVICANPTGFVSQLPGNPFVTPAQVTAAISAVCATNGYTNGMPATVTAGNCVYPSPSALSTPAPAAMSHSRD